MTLPIQTICIYHANCADGFAAAWVVRRALGPMVQFHPAKYGDPAPDVTGKIVVIVDFSYSYEILTGMAEAAESVLVLDHHKTAQEALANVPSPGHCSGCKNHNHPGGKLHALFDMTRSGAGLTWDYFFAPRPRPALINHIEDRDLWLFELVGTREVMASVFSYPQDFDVWDQLFRADIERLRIDGAAIERKHHKDVTELVAATKRRMVIGGFEVPVVNLPHTFASDAGALLSQGEAFAACYWDTPDGRSFSLRSTDAGEDVSDIAKQYGGGGHRNASGFRVPFDHVLASPERVPAVGRNPISDEELIEIARKAAVDSTHRYNYMPALQEDALLWTPHRWVIEAMHSHAAPLLAEIERLKGLQPAFPPRPPEGSGLPRYGLRWNGPQHPLAVQMDDGYWTPWHLAVQVGGSHG